MFSDTFCTPHGHIHYTTTTQCIDIYRVRDLDDDKIVYMLYRRHKSTQIRHTILTLFFEERSERGEEEEIRGWQSGARVGVVPCPQNCHFFHESETLLT